MGPKDKIREFVLTNLVVFDDDVQLKDDDNFFELGFVDSPFAIQLVAFVESEFNVEVSDSDLDIMNFNSLNRIAAFVDRKS